MFPAGGKGTPQTHRSTWPAEETLLPPETAEAQMHPHSFTCQTMGLHLFI